MNASNANRPLRALSARACALAWLTLATSLLAAAGPSVPQAEQDSAWIALMHSQRTATRASGNLQESRWMGSTLFKASDFTQQFAPEKTGFSEAESGRRKAWQAKSFPNGTVNRIKTKNRSTLYLYRTLTAKTPETVQIRLGSSGGLALWVNGELKLSKDVTRGAAPDQDRVEAKLNAGINTLLLKLHFPQSDASFYYNTDSSVPGALALVALEFPAQTALFQRYAAAQSWFESAADTRVERTAIKSLLDRSKSPSSDRDEFARMVRDNAPPGDPRWLGLFLSSARRLEVQNCTLAEIKALDLAALRRAITDLSTAFPDEYGDGSAYLQQLDAFEKQLPGLMQQLEKGDASAVTTCLQLIHLRQEALLANPLLDFDQLMVIKRREDTLGLPQNWQGNSSLNPHMDNELCLMSAQQVDPPLKPFFKPARPVFVGDVDLHFDAEKLLFSSIGTHNRWQVFEINLNGTGLRQVTRGEEPDIDNYDAIYLQDDRILFDSTSTFQGVPCVGGGDYVANLHLMNPDGSNIRRLCYDQDNDWYPVLLPSGRVMYLRWEYTDSAHYFSRVLMSMNPDGTGQTAVYHSNSYWPNGLWYARPLPGSNSRFVAVISGHHGVPRMGELALFDVSKGRREDTGAIQRIPGFGKPVQGIIKDSLVDSSWPKFLHPYPLSDKYFVVACKPTPDSSWGIYLVDIFDNLLLLKEEPGWALLEPLPVRKTERPPRIVDTVKPGATNATVYVHDIYAGPGLRGVPSGTVKQLRVFQYEFSYRNQGGHYFIGMEGGWDVRRLIGTVPVEQDGSALFHIPANTPVALQPLDQEGKALQQMRSWLVGMPGEYVSCVGCHESQNSTAVPKLGLAARKAPVDPAPWRGPKRGFGFVREVQPVLDQYCAGCHNGQAGRPNLADPTVISTSGGISRLPRSYVELHPYVRRNGPEGDYNLLTPLEFHANTSLLVQMLCKGHHNVKLDSEAWDRLITWIDLNVPAYGTYHEVQPIPSNFQQRRYEARKLYSGVDEDIEAIPAQTQKRPEFTKPEPMPPRPAPLAVPGWPLQTEKARALQETLGKTDLSFDLGEGVRLPLKKVPAGQFAMGDVAGDPNEYPQVQATIAHPFWIGTTEVSLEQYQRFDPAHRNGYYDMHYKDQVKPGYLMDHPELPVIRVSWQDAMAFCQWLSARTGKRVSLPTEAQWEWACRAGSDRPMFYGDLNSDFAAWANLADASLSQLAVSGVNPQPIDNPDRFWDFVPKEARFNDGSLHLAPVTHYQPNAWSVQNMIGNVAEWTLDNYQARPGLTPPPGPDNQEGVLKVVRGGSWSDRPREARAAVRWNYPAWQRVYNVGFRIVVED